MTQIHGDDELREGEVAARLPAVTDAGVYFIGVIHTPWKVRGDCPKRGTMDGPVCSIVVDERWRQGLTDIGDHPRIQVLYWMHRARRDLVLQRPNPYWSDNRDFRATVARAAKSNRIFGRGSGWDRGWDLACSRSGLSGRDPAD